MMDDAEFRIGDLVFEKYYLENFCIPLPVFIVSVDEEKYHFYYLCHPEKVYNKTKNIAKIEWSPEEFNWYGK